MSRADRLLRLMQVLRAHRTAISGETLARELGVSRRTLYRDIALLRDRGARLEGAAGLGYVLKPDFTLPPLNFTEEEVEALALGGRWVMTQGDRRLAEAAREARAKIRAVLPPARRDLLESSGLSIPGGPTAPGNDEVMDLVRQALRKRHKLRITYRDSSGTSTERIIWPFLMGYFKETRVVAAWCEARQDYRHFRADRIIEAGVLEQTYPRPREKLEREWRLREGIPTPED